MKPTYFVLNPLHMKVTMNLPSPKKNSKKRPALANYAPTKNYAPNRHHAILCTNQSKK